MKESLLKAFNLMPELKRNIDSRFQEELSIVFNIFKSWLWFFLAVCLSVISLFLDIKYDCDYYFFQRSGALIVLGGATIEFQLSKYPRWFLEDMLHIEHDSIVIWDRFFKYSRIFRNIGWFSIVVGTLIWAYGDTPFR